MTDKNAAISTCKVLPTLNTMEKGFWHLKHFEEAFALEKVIILMKGGKLQILSTQSLGD